MYLGGKVTRIGNEDLKGTLIDERYGDFRVLWEDGEETLEPREDLEPLTGWDAQPAYQEGPGGL
jgi:hypothetical protein